jgi:hypothetical protein
VDKRRSAGRHLFSRSPILALLVLIAIFCACTSSSSRGSQPRSSPDVGTRKTCRTLEQMVNDDNLTRYDVKAWTLLIRGISRSASNERIRSLAETLYEVAYVAERPWADEAAELASACEDAGVSLNL